MLSNCIFFTRATLRVVLLFPFVFISQVLPLSFSLSKVSSCPYLIPKHKSFRFKFLKHHHHLYKSCFIFVELGACDTDSYKAVCSSHVSFTFHFLIPCFSVLLFFSLFLSFFSVSPNKIFLILLFVHAPYMFV